VLGSIASAIPAIVEAMSWVNIPFMVSTPARVNQAPDDPKDGGCFKQGLHVVDFSVANRNPFVGSMGENYLG
ncbi:MAG: hypothetical protein HKN32_06700, partial [Flavobacteriales bacterium]|nr:hypothetical protein [Flavobacteriales bacterium]